MVKLISTLGTSPGGVFETLNNLRRGNYNSKDNVVPVKITEVYVVRTKDRSVELAWKLIKGIFACCGDNEVELVDIPLEISDINSVEDYDYFKKEVSSKISAGDYIDFTGGRKAMSVAAAIEAKRLNAHIVTTIIPQDEYNAIQSKIKGINVKDLDNIIGNIKNIKSENTKEACSKFDFCSLTSKNAKTILLD
ncbi:CRISPR-associated protein [Acidianus sulfidivorans JP7]|uniref:CRISPR-associated protein n=1 Tax=Acidianus sulfidivorans JP7 TaxID=619593 RepID=A0A2U9IJN5_9CREN|nr:CRISPR-associated ring nuclease Crn1 [Acidianus sulfidivorans]AWR96166.1 CRISPR-associated protein [Acidianus sulfidivorans JP7]